jgi:hypothetical protein
LAITPAVRCPRRSSPCATFRRHKVHSLEARSQLKGNRGHRLKPAFRSPVATGFLGPPQRGQRSWPSPSAKRGTFFTARSALAPPPGVGRLPNAASGSSRPAPLRCLQSHGFPCRTSFCSPPRVLRPFTDQRFQRLNSVKAYPRIGPISLRSPPAHLSILPADQRSRSATIPEANC